MNAVSLPTRERRGQSVMLSGLRRGTYSLRVSLFILFFVLSSSHHAVRAQGDIIQQLLRESFACPSEEYQYKEPVNYYLKLLDRYRWVGDAFTFKLHITSKEMAGSIRGIDTRIAEKFVEAPFRDISVSVEDGVDVTIRCKSSRQCIAMREKRPDQDEEQYAADHVYFHACSLSTADNINIAIQQLINDHGR